MKAEQHKVCCNALLCVVEVYKAEAPAVFLFCCCQATKDLTISCQSFHQVLFIVLGHHDLAKYNMH